MIGGTDIVLPARGGLAAMGASLREIQRMWPEAVVEDALSGRRVRSYEPLPGVPPQEAFVYQTEAIAQAWDEQGAAPSLENTMIHLLRGKDTLTIVVDRAEVAPMPALVQAIRAALSEDTTGEPADQRRAV
jgi:hypothetical protein